MSNGQWGLKPIQSPRRNSLADLFHPKEECSHYVYSILYDYLIVKSRGKWVKKIASQKKILYTLNYQIIVQDGINVQGGTFPKYQ